MIATAAVDNPVRASPAVPAGSGRLHVAADATCSRVQAAFAASPLRLLTPRNHGHAAWIYTSTYGGGLLAGDALHLSVDVGDAATAFLSTQASTKVYRSRGAMSSSVLDATLHPGSLLIVAPDPVACFATSRYTQTQRFALDGTAALVVVDWYTAGRHAMGERWACDSYSTRTEVRRDGRLIWYDALRLSGDDGSIADRLGRFDVVASIAMFGTSVQEHAVQLVARVASLPVERRAPLVATASAIDDGCVVRLAGVSVEEVSRTIRRYLAFVPRLLGDDPWARRW